MKTETELEMMKKKIHFQKETEQNYSNKTTENKENSQVQENEKIINNETVPSSDSMNSAANDARASDNSLEKLAEMQDKYIRLSAEYDNYRKRTLREKMELSKYASENLLLKIIPLMDDFDRALQHMDSAADCAAIKDGIGLIYGKFNEFLKQTGVKEIESLNNVFDVNLHEAVAKVPVQEDDKKGKIVDVLQKGYYLQDKVLRFSKVVVGE